MTEQRIGIQIRDTYPKRIASQLDEAYSRANLSVVGGAAGRVLSSRDVSAFTPPFPFAKDDLSQAAASLQFGARLVQVTEGMLIPSPKKGERYIGGISAHDYRNVPIITHGLASDLGAKSPVAIRAVFGGTKSMQFRSLSMLIPVLQQMERLAASPSEKVTAPTPPQAQIIFANHIAEYIRGFNYEEMAAQTREFVDIAEAYVERFFPSVSGHLVFLEDAPVEDGSFIKEEMARLQGVASENLPNDLKEKIASKKSGEGNGNSLMYAAAHLLMHDSNNPDLLHPLSTNRANSLVPSAIISVGGRQEEDFCDVRFALREAAGSAYQLPTVQLFTKHKVPPYTPADKGDIALSDVVRKGVDPRRVEGVDPLAVNDLIFLYAATEGRGSMDDFILNYRERLAA